MPNKMEEWRRSVLEDRHQQRGILSLLRSGHTGYGRPKVAAGGHGSHGVRARRGLPWFVALFGRDTLIVSLQTMIVYPEFAAGALEVLAEYQATERDDYRDAEPGKILHEFALTGSSRTSS